MKTRLLPLLLIPLFWVPMAQGENLMQVYELALQNDAQFRAARATRDSAFESRPQAVAQLLPNISMSGKADRIDSKVVNTSTGATSSLYNKNSLTLSLSMPIYRRELWVQLDQADDQIAQAEAVFAAAEQDLIVRTAQAYFDILSAQESLEFANAETAAIGRQLEQAKQRFDVGLIAITAVHEAQAAYDQSRADLIQAENDLDNAREALYEITKSKLNRLAALDKNLVLSRPVPENIEQWGSKALDQNLSIKAAEKATAIARSNVKVKQSGHLPSLDLVGSHSRNRYVDSLSSDTNNSSIGIQLTVPLFAGGAVNSQTRQARYDLEASQENLDKERRSVIRQVRDAYRGVLASISSVKALKASTVSTRSALEATEAGYEVGTRTIVDVLNSQRDLYRSLKNFANVRYNYIMSGLKLKQAAGTVSEQDLKQITAWLR
jgi:outer membrane protein